MSFTFDPYKLQNRDVSAAEDVLMTNPTALTELESYWRSLPRVRGVPQRKDIDPSKMDGLLENSFILERVAPGVARIRVAGRGITNLLGIEPRGVPLTAAFLPAARATISRNLETAFTSPGLVEIELIGPRAVGQPLLKGKVLLLPLRDDHGRVTRVMGALVMSGRRGLGGRRFDIAPDTKVRFEPSLDLHAVPDVGAPDAGNRDVGAYGAQHATTPKRPSLRMVDTGADGNKTKDRPALRLVVSNP